MSQGWLIQGIAPSHSTGQCTPAIKIKTNVWNKKIKVVDLKLKTMCLIWYRCWCHVMELLTFVCLIRWVSRRAPVPMLNPRMRLPKASAVKRAAVGTFQLSGIESQFGNFLPGSTPINSLGGMLTVHRPTAAALLWHYPCIPNPKPPSCIWHFFTSPLILKSFSFRFQFYRCIIFLSKQKLSRYRYQKQTIDQIYI